jgi:hypothetical protein
MRGSIPLSWSQEVRQIVPKPPITMGNVDPFCRGASRLRSWFHVPDFSCPTVFPNQHGCMEKGGHRLPKVSFGLAMYYPSTATPHRVGGLRSSSTLLDTPRRLPVQINHLQYTSSPPFQSPASISTNSWNASVLRSSCSTWSRKRSDASTSRSLAPSLRSPSGRNVS